MDTAGLHLPQQYVDRLGLGHEGRRPHDLRDARRAVGVGLALDPAGEILEIDHPDDVVDVLADHRDPGEAAAQCEREGLTDALGALDPDHVRPRHHDLAHDRVAEFED